MSVEVFTVLSNKMSPFWCTFTTFLVAFLITLHVKYTVHRLLIIVASHRLIYGKALAHSSVIFTTVAVAEILVRALAITMMMRVEIVTYTPHSYALYFVSRVGYTLLMTMHAHDYIQPLLLGISLSCSNCLLAIISKCIGIGTWLAALNKKERRALTLMCALLIASAFGIGLCLLVFTWSMRNLKLVPYVYKLAAKLSRYCLLVRISIPFIVYGGGKIHKSTCQGSSSTRGSGTGQQQSGKPPSKRYRDECRDKENETPGDSGNPPKRSRKRGLHDGHSCGDCAVWVLSGKDVHVKYRHTWQHSMKHPGAKAAEFSSWLSTRDKIISLESDSCMCNACYADCLRCTGEPRWVRDMPKEHKHCFVCCTGALCECRSIQEWGSMDWLEEENITNWTTYFRVLGDMKEDNCTTD